MRDNPEGKPTMPEITTAIIPVAGMGTRFLPATKAQPKEMLPLVDKPVIQYVVEEASEAGIKNIVFITGRGKQAIENHFDTAFELEHMLTQRGCVQEVQAIRKITRLLNFAYIRQGEPLGLGHAINCAASVTGGAPVAVLLGDDVFSQEQPALNSLLSAHRQTGLSIVGVQKVPLCEVSRYGIVNGPKANESQWQIDNIVEKPNPQNAPSQYAVVGRYILTPDVFQILKNLRPGHGGEYQLTDALSELARAGKLMATVISNQRFDTGNKLEYLKACIDFALARPEFSEELEKHILNCADRLSLDKQARA